jgi:hypothetical protein
LYDKKTSDCLCRGKRCSGGVFRDNRAVIATEKQQGLAVAGGEPQDFADHDVMIARIVNLKGLALEAGQRIGEYMRYCGIRSTRKSGTP